MSDPTPVAATEELRAIYTFAVIGLYLSVAVLLAAARDASLARRLLAAFFAVLAVQQLATPVAGRLLGLAAPDATWQGLRILRTLCWVGFIALYPSPVRLRSWQGLVVAAVAVHALVLAGAWALAREAFADFTTAAVLTGPNVGLALAGAAAVATGFARAWPLQGNEQRGAFLVLAGAGLLVFPGLGDGLMRLALTALGEPDIRTDPAVLADPVVLGLHLAYLALAGGLAGLVAVRHRAWAPLLLAAWGALLIAALAAMPGPAGGFAQFQNAPVALAVFWAVARHHALGASLAPHRLAGPALAVVAFVTLFVMTSIFVVTFTSDPFLLATGTLASLAAGSLGAVAVLAPATLRLGPATPDRLGPYRAALAAEVAAGAAPDDTSRRLLPLRQELGITDTEHALMDYTLRGGARPAVVAALDPGALFAGRYRVDRGLGRDGEGPAYLCRDERAGREVVVKLVRGPGGGGLDGVVREARALAAVRHPRVVALYDVEAVGNHAFLVMEYAAQGSLAARLQRGALPRAEWAALARDLLDGLDAVHRAGLVHRDVKPSNVLLADDGRAKLGDFGIARQASLDATVGWNGPASAVGTVRYMSPEQAKGRTPTARSDLYSAGLVLYEAWTGQPYVEARSGESLVEAQLRVAGARGFDRALKGPPGLRAWFRRALEPDPEQRFPSARHMARELDAALGPRGDR